MQVTLPPIFKKKNYTKRNNRKKSQSATWKTIYEFSSQTVLPLFIHSFLCDTKPITLSFVLFLLLFFFFFFVLNMLDVESIKFYYFIFDSYGESRLYIRNVFLIEEHIWILKHAGSILQTLFCYLDPLLHTQRDFAKDVS